MYPSPNNCYNPFDDDHHHHHHIKPSSSNDHHQNPNHSKSSSDHHPDPPFLLPFPPTFFDDQQMSISPLNQILLQAQTPTQQENKSEKKPSIRPRRPQRNQLGPIPRRRAGKKDRHSKICTAQGIRDRRMRLSLQIARKFFDLQDALGYDKASKTIEWLFAKSKKAIRELAKAQPHYHDDVSNSCSSAKSESFVVSDCEVVSGMLLDDDVKEGSSVVRPSSRSESREWARARARCRTRERMMVKVVENTSVDHGVEKLGFLNSPMFEGVDNQGSNQLDDNNNNNNQEKVSLYGNLYNSLEQQFGDVGTLEKFLGNSSTSNVSCPNYYSSVSGYMDSSNGFTGFLGNWDVFNGTKRTNSVLYGIANDQVSSGENPSSIYSATHHSYGD